MLLKSLAVAAAAVAFGGAALINTAPAGAATTAKGSTHVAEARYGGPPEAQRHRRPSRVQASGVARGAILVPYFVKKARAQREAIENWSSKVAGIYGSQYASWSQAQGKTTSCGRIAGGASCRVSAVPGRGYGRFGHLQ